MDFLKFNIQGTILEISRVELEPILIYNWYLANLLNSEGDRELYEKNGAYIIYEDVQIFKDIIDSMRYHTLIITDSKKLHYYQKLCEKWCVPEWLLEELQQRLEIDRIKNDFIKSIFSIKKCVNCYVSYKEEENHNKACHFHSDTMEDHKILICCGYNLYHPVDNNKYCCEGYHMSDKSNDLDILERFIKLN